MWKSSCRRVRAVSACVKTPTAWPGCAWVVVTATVGRSKPTGLPPLGRPETWPTWPCWWCGIAARSPRSEVAGKEVTARQEDWAEGWKL